MDGMICHGYRIEIRILIFYQGEEFEETKNQRDNHNP